MVVPDNHICNSFTQSENRSGGGLVAITTVAEGMPLPPTPGVGGKECGVRGIRREVWDVGCEASGVGCGV